MLLAPHVSSNSNHDGHSHNKGSQGNHGNRNHSEGSGLSVGSVAIDGKVGGGDLLVSIGVIAREDLVRLLGGEARGSGKLGGGDRVAVVSVKGGKVLPARADASTLVHEGKGALLLANGGLEEALVAVSLPVGATDGGVLLGAHGVTAIVTGALVGHGDHGLGEAGVDLEEAEVIVGISIRAAEGGVVHGAELGAIIGGGLALSLAGHSDLSLGIAGSHAEITLVAIGNGIRATDGAVLHSAGNVAISALSLVGHGNGVLGEARADLEIASIGIGISIRATNGGVISRAVGGAISRDILLARPAVLDVNRGLEGAHLGPQLALIGISNPIGATDRGKALWADLRALGLWHAGVLGTGGGETLLWLGEADGVLGARGIDAGVFEAVVLGTGGGEAFLALNGATGATGAAGGGADVL